jgi:hypothetical protein
LAFSPAGERYTAFTKELIDILEKGLPENTEFLTLERIFREVKTRITTNPSLPEPQCNIPFGLPEFTLSRNINWSSNPEIRVSNIKALYEKELASKDAQLEDMEQRHIAKLAEMSSEITHFQNIEREIHVELSEKKQRITQLENLFMPMEQRYKNELTQMGKELADLHNIEQKYSDELRKKDQEIASFQDMEQRHNVELLEKSKKITQLENDLANVIKPLKFSYWLGIILLIAPIVGSSIAYSMIDILYRRLSVGPDIIARHSAYAISFTLAISTLLPFCLLLVKWNPLARLWLTRALVVAYAFIMVLWGLAAAS